LNARRQGKSLAILEYIKYALQTHTKITIGTSDVDALYNHVKAAYPDARLTKFDGYLMVENEKS